MCYTNEAKLFKVLSDETRLSIIKALSEKTHCACQLLEGFSISQSTLSHHMKILTSAKLVTASKKGKWVYYDIDAQMLAVLKTFINDISIKNQVADPC